MDVQRYFNALKGQGQLESFTDDELRTLIMSCRPWSLHVGRALWRVGDRRSHAYIIVEGAIEKKGKSYAGRIHEPFTQPGTILSLTSLVHDWPYHTSATPSKKSEVLMFARPAFEELFEQEDPVAWRITDVIGEYLVQDMRQANERLQEVFGHPAETLRMLKRRVREDTKA